jgi:hypothetical protein
MVNSISAQAPRYKIETAGSSKTVTIYKMTPYHNPGDCNMQMNRISCPAKIMLHSVKIGILISCTILQNAKRYYKEEKHTLMLEN